MKLITCLVSLLLSFAFATSAFGRPNRPPPYPVRSQIINCSSVSHDPTQCYVGQVNVRIVRQVSDATCALGTTWGYDAYSGYIWVDRGCRADFEISERRGGYNPGPAPGSDSLITCESIDFKLNRCSGNGYFRYVEIQKQRSGAACEYGKSWGYDSQYIWVSNGCRATFRAIGY